MAQVAYQVSTGPVHIFVGFPSGSAGSYKGTVPTTGLYLGTCERYPEVMALQHWNPVFNDIGGPMEPFDHERQGENKVIVMEVNKTVQAVVNSIINPVDGQMDYEYNGQLLQANGLYFGLWLIFTYSQYWSSTNDPSGGTLPAGEFYPCCRVPENGFVSLGTITRKSRLAVATSPLYDASTGNRFTYSNLDSYFDGISILDIG